MTPRRDSRRPGPVDELAVARARKRIDALLEAHPELASEANLDRLRSAMLADDRTDDTDTRGPDDGSPQER